MSEYNHAVCFQSYFAILLPNDAQRVMHFAEAADVGSSHKGAAEMCWNETACFVVVRGNESCYQQEPAKEELKVGMGLLKAPNSK